MYILLRPLYFVKSPCIFIISFFYVTDFFLWLMLSVVQRGFSITNWSFFPCWLPVHPHLRSNFSLRHVLLSVTNKEHFKFLTVFLVFLLFFSFMSTKRVCSDYCPKRFRLFPRGLLSVFFLCSYSKLCC